MDCPPIKMSPGAVFTGPNIARRIDGTRSRPAHVRRALTHNVILFLYSANFDTYCKNDLHRSVDGRTAVCLHHAGHLTFLNQFRYSKLLNIVNTDKSKHMILLILILQTIVV